jgi:heat shock protein HslJ
LTLAVAPQLAACDNEAAPGTPPAVAAARAATALRHTWNLASLLVDGQEVQLVKGAPADLELGLSSVLGSTGCHSYASAYRAGADGAFALEELGVTEAECEEPVASQASAYLAALRRVTHWALPDPDSLELSGKGVLMAFDLAPQPPPPDESAEVDFAGTWELTALTTPAGSRSLPADRQVTFAVAARTALGNSGCNDYAARLVAVGARSVRLIRFTAGLKACRPVARVHAFEDAFQSAMVNVDRWELAEDSQLVLTGRGLELRFAKVGPPPDLPLRQAR